MADTPFVRGKVVWLYTIPQFILIFLLCWVFSLGTEDNTDIIYGFFAYWIIIYALRNLVARQHRQGIALLKKNNFEQALLHFQKSVAYFERNPWIDKYRYITLLSASKMTYREMGLCNVAFCHSQLGRGAEAKEIYTEVLNQYPENGIAAAALKMMQAQ
jgi:tetratricopeptide (TPR) repeat protein